MIPQACTAGTAPAVLGPDRDEAVWVLVGNMIAVRRSLSDRPPIFGWLVHPGRTRRARWAAGVFDGLAVAVGAVVGVDGGLVSELVSRSGTDGRPSLADRHRIVAELLAAAGASSADVAAGGRR